MKTIHYTSLFLVVLFFTACTGKSGLKTPEFDDFTHWETQTIEYESDAEMFSLTIPDFFSVGNPLIISMLTLDAESNKPNSTISLNDDDESPIVVFYEPTLFHQTAIESTTVSVGDIDGNGLADIKMFFPYMGNGLDACAVRSIYLFQEKDKKFNKISFDSYVCQDDITEIDADGDGKYEIVARELQYTDDNPFWVDNLYKYTPDGLVCVSEKNGYPKVFSVNDGVPAEKNIVNTHKKEWTLPLPNEYNFLKSTDPDAGLFTEQPVSRPEIATAKWTKYPIDAYGCIVEYPDLGFEPLHIDDHTFEFGDLFTLTIEEQTDEMSGKSSAEILKKKYMLLSDNPQWVSFKLFNGKQYGYADFIGIDHPNVKSRTLMALAQNGIHTYRFECLNPDDDMVKVFQKILGKFQVAQE